MLLFVYSPIKNINWIQPKSDKHPDFSNQDDQTESINDACGKAIEDIRRIEANYYLERRSFW